MFSTSMHKRSVFAVVIEGAGDIGEIAGNHHIALVVRDWLFDVLVAHGVPDGAYGRKKRPEESDSVEYSNS